jgi:uncharacterized protein (TIGR03067 family)
MNADPYAQPSPNLPVSPPTLAMSNDQLGPPPATNSDTRFQGGSIRIFRVAGIDVFLHWSWFVFAFLMFQPSDSHDTFRVAQYDSQLLYGVEYLVVFVIVLLHEFGHVLACRWVGGIANRITLWPLGGLAYVDPPPGPRALLWSIGGGPLVNVLLLAPTIGFWFACRSLGYPETAPDFYRFVANVAWINGYMLVFNLLPIFPLDGGRILQAILWFLMGRARSLLMASLIGLLTAFGLLAFAISQRSMFEGVIAALGLLFSVVTFQGARTYGRMQRAPRREDSACPSCRTAPPIGDFWVCPRCVKLFDVFASDGNCPNCSTPVPTVTCAECSRTRPYTDWLTNADRREPLATSEPPQRTPSAPTATVGQRVLWGLIFAAIGFSFCGLANMEKQPLGLLFWPAAGALFGATSAGTMVNIQRIGQARKKLQGTWSLIEEDGQAIGDSGTESWQLILKIPAYEEHVGGQSDMRGTCWTDFLADPPAISFTPKTGPEVGKPRQGIYRVENKVLTLCLAFPGHPRPTTFLPQIEIQQVRVYQKKKRRSRK